MLAFKNTEYTKIQAVGRALQNYYGDCYKQKTGWRGLFRTTSAAGCMLGVRGKGWDYADAEPSFGIPKYLFVMQETIFEKLNPQAAKEWMPKLIAAIPEGADLSQVEDKMYHFILSDPFGVRNDYRMPNMGLMIIDQLTSLYYKKIAGGTFQEWDDWRNAAHAIIEAYSFRDATSDEGFNDSINNVVLSCAIQQDYALTRACDIMGPDYWNVLADKFLEYVRRAPVPKPRRSKETFVSE